MQTTAVSCPASIFRAYDIRGIVGETLTAEILFTIGLAIGTLAIARGVPRIVVACDGRLSGPEFKTALTQGLIATGIDVIDIGAVPTPVLYFACHQLQTGSGIMITGSHNPAEYNGLKIMLNGETLTQDTLQKIYHMTQAQNFVAGQGKLYTQDIVNDYFTAVTSRIKLQRKLNVVIDCGNGIAGKIAQQLFTALGCNVTGLFCEVDGTFPNHHPNPSQPENLQDLIRTVKQTGADIGLAFDGDGDRLGVVTAFGEIIWPDRQMMLFAQDILQHYPGETIIFDVKCSRNLSNVITAAGGKPLMNRTGHSYIKAKLKETKAPFAGEMSGHLFFNDNWFGFDDGLYAGARLLQIIAAISAESLATLWQTLPNSPCTPEINIPIPDDQKFLFIEKLQQTADFDGAEYITLDGLRVEFADGWGLIRASNTTPYLVARFEAEDESALIKIQDRLREKLLCIEPALECGF